ncbi:MAG TPA: hypothetical protein VFS10_18445 [Pyrinomonadaceae bacterium]|nr:hypothetical protein [Pyrinomonadaceae bacterium]
MTKATVAVLAAPGIGEIPDENPSARRSRPPLKDVRERARRYRHDRAWRSSYRNST